MNALNGFYDWYVRVLKESINTFLLLWFFYFNIVMIVLIVIGIIYVGGVFGEIIEGALK